MCQENVVGIVGENFIVGKLLQRSSARKYKKGNVAIEKKYSGRKIHKENISVEKYLGKQ